MQGEFSMDLSFCQAENGFSLDELVQKVLEVFERKAFSELLRLILQMTQEILLYRILHGKLDGMVIPSELKVGDVVAVEGLTLDKEKYRLNLNDSLIELPLMIAENIWGIPVK